MKKLILCSTVFVVLMFLFLGLAKVAKAQSQNLVCDWNQLEVLPYPDPRNWNFTGQFQVTNKASYPMSFRWLLDMWGHSSQNQSGTTTLQPGESKVYGFGNICPKWQFDVWCGDKEWGAIVEEHVPACTQPTPTPTITPAPTPVVTPTPGPEKQSSLAVTSISCGQSHMDAIAKLTLDDKPVSGVSVKFTYNNEAKFAKTDAEGKATVQYGYRSDSDLKIDPEDGYPAQSQRVADPALHCPVDGIGMVLGTSTLAKAGTIEDTIAVLSGLSGFLMTAGTFIYAKKNSLFKA